MAQLNLFNEAEPFAPASPVTKVIHVRDMDKYPDSVYIGRAGHGMPGTWGNPIKPGETCFICGEIHQAAETLGCYEIYLKQKLCEQEFRERFFALRGKALACFCAKKKGFSKNVICHGQVMALILDKESEGSL
jgi:hypothetical protein